MIVLALPCFSSACGGSAEEVKIVAVDLQAMAPIPGVVQIQGDITKVGGVVCQCTVDLRCVPVYC